jgi:mRNA-degrading endonuclease RelE of RelBE toxin-antitoxin system
MRSLPPATKKKIHQALDAIADRPFCGKALQEELTGLRSYKMDTTRIVYKFENKAITLIAIGPRKTIYQRVILELKRRFC